MADEPSIEITVSATGPWSIVAVRGDLDMATAPQLEDTCRSLDSGVALDLSGVGFIDSSGLRALVRVREMHDEMALVDPSAGVRRLLELTQMTDAFRLAADADALDETG